VVKPNLKMELTGVKELKREARKVASNKEINKALKDANKESADLVADRSTSTVPVRSGQLKQAIKGHATSKVASVKVGGKAAAYAGRIHYGDPGDSPIKGQPFVHEALSDVWDKVYDSYEAAITDIAMRLNTTGGLG